MGVLDGAGLGKLWERCKAAFAFKEHVHNAATVASTGFVKPDGTSLTVAFDGTLSVQNVDAAAFLSGYPLLSYYESESPLNPSSIYGGTWERMPSLGGFRWRRIAPVAAIDTDLFLQAHPVSSYIKSDTNPAATAGTWEQLPKSIGAPVWRRTA